jgi:EAL domain-containing protein (putative c-di-GMP-specific phosphodiesterase class I)
MRDRILLVKKYNENVESKWCIEAVSDEGREWTVNIDSLPFVIGRASDCDFKFIDDRISRHHCELRMSGGMLWIRDLGSTNGTFLNKKQIEHAEMLDSGDIIAIGKYQFKTTKINSSSSATEKETLCSTICEDMNDLSGLESKIRHIIDERNVLPHFQPIVRFSDMRHVGYEILGRVDDEILPSNPSELLDIAESLGISSELSSLFREVGVEVGKKLPGMPLFFVNAGRFEMYEMNSLLESLKKIRDIAPSNQVVLEINESAASDSNELSELRDALKMMNISLAFDDFGVGQTRLIELSNVSPEYLKFDISLIRQIHLAPKGLHQMISTFIKASHDLGILTLAEGIECADELEVCQQIGFDFGQGFFLGKPEPIDAIHHNPGYDDRKSAEIQYFQQGTEPKCVGQKKESKIVKVDFSRTIVLND